MTGSTNAAHMRRALELATRAIGLAEPNPRVGCVLVGADGQEIGSGHTQQVGAPHAEIMALADAQARGHATAGATAYVTLEPCSHHGRTGPCCDALVAAGVARVVAAIADPNPLVGGQGFARLRAAGVAVQVGALAGEARELNLGFFSRMLRQTPWVRLKVAASLDGKTALDNGASQWITGEAARADGHAWRARACALLTGIGTVRQDNPRLDVRLPGMRNPWIPDQARDDNDLPSTRQPALVVVDSRLETPGDARLFDAKRPVLIYAAQHNPTAEAALTARGASVVYLPGRHGADGSASGNADKVDLRAMLADLAAREVNELHVEAGTQLNGSLLRAGLVDELLLYLAPRLLGQGRDLARFGPLTMLDQAVQLEFRSTSMIGPDLRIVARLAGRDRF